MRRLLSLWLPDFAIEQSRRRQPQADPGAPLALVRAERGRLLLAALDARAAAAGLLPGQPLAAARALLPALETRPADPPSERAALEALLRWCGRYTPWAALDPWHLEPGHLEPGHLEPGHLEPGHGERGDAGLFLEITGCAHLLGGEAALAEDLRRRLAASGTHARLGLAATPGAAWALARHATRPDRPVALLPPEARLAEGLSRLPVAALRLPPTLLELLARLGLERIGQLLGLPAASLLPRFGPELGRRLAQALGWQDEPIDPARPQELPWAARHFAEPLVAAEDLERGLALLLDELTAELARRGQGARRLEFLGHRVDGGRSAIAIGLSRPSRDPRHLARLFAPKRERLDPGFGFETLTLVAREVERLAAAQPALALAESAAPDSAPAQTGARESNLFHPAARQEAAAAPPSPLLAALVDRLENRLGAGSVRRLEPCESHWPETAVRAHAPFAASSPAEGAVPSRPRPLFLLRQPEPLGAAGSERPPAQFAWRKRRLALRQAEGPERLEPPWWQPERAAEATRDYWQVEDETGRRYWIFRRHGGVTGDEGWFLHGLFA